jgi:5-methylcytosine-specific restriction enzyme subunit McrC
MKNIPIKNIYYLLAYAWDKLPESRKISIEGCDFRSEVDFLAFVLEKGLTHLLKRGLDRDYLVFEEDTSFPRGKWDIQTTLKRGLLARQKIHCEYTAMDHNLLHNQIIKTTLRKLLCTESLDSKIQHDLRQIYSILGGIDIIPLTDNCFKKVRLHRNNAFYGFLLNICELIYLNLSPSENAGRFRFADFTRDDDKMAALFEAFVRNFYKKELPSAVYPTVDRESFDWDMQETMAGSYQYLPMQKTDTTITYRDKHKFIVETKYYNKILKQNYGKDRVNSDNVRQITTYLELCPEAFGGLLLYAQSDEELDLRFIWRNKSLRIYSLDLSHPWRSIHEDLLSLIPG